MNVILWDDYVDSGSIRNEENIKDIEVIAVVEDIDEIGPLIEIDGVVYGMASVDKRLGFISVQKIYTELGVHEGSCCDDEITCPNCGSETSESWEHDEYGTLDCDYCGAEFDFTRNVSVSYTTNVKKVGPSPLKLKNIALKNTKD